MLYVNDDGSIQLTRGDTARLSITIENDLTGSDYTIAATDTLKFTIKKNVNDSTPCIQKVNIGSAQFTIEPSDTKDLPYGKYMYDVELTTDSGDVYTVVVPTAFKILKEVTW